MNGGLKGVKSLLSPARYSRRCDRRHSAIIHVIRSASVVWGKERVALKHSKSLRPARPDVTDSVPTYADRGPRNRQTYYSTADLD